MSCARSVFKNVGLQSVDSKLIVAIWGDEGLDMPLTGPTGEALSLDPSWLRSLVNSRHERNWAKIDRFTAAIRAMEPIPTAQAEKLRHFDVVGDVAVAHARPMEDLELLGKAILKQEGPRESPCLRQHPRPRALLSLL